MARKPMVTRTITTTKASVLCMDIQSAEPFNKVITLPRTYKDDKTLMKRVQEVVETDNIKAVHIVDKEEVETLYGMTEQEFIEKAVVLDPETRKALESGAEVEEAQETVEQ
jgi:LytS/YehU family sensor histidine kinase